MVYFYRLLCQKCGSVSGDFVQLSTHAPRVSMDMTSEGEKGAAAEWIEAHQDHGNIILLHQDDRRAPD